jgi:sugar phosphate isomerase/epimerase
MRDPSIDPSEEHSRLSFRLAAFNEWTLNKAISSIAETGYQAIDLCLEHPEVNPEKLTGKKAEKVKKLLQDKELRVSALSCHDKSDDIAAVYQRRIKALDLAVELGAPLLIVGTVPESADPGGRRTSEGLISLLHQAGEKNVKIAIETEPDSVLHGYYDFSMLVTNFGDLPLGLNLNVAHTALTEGDLGEIIDEARPFIFSAYISDSFRNEHVHLIPGEGHLDLPKVFQSLRRNYYSGDYILDPLDATDPPDQVAQKALEKCQEIFA